MQVVLLGNGKTYMQTFDCTGQFVYIPIDLKKKVVADSQDSSYHKASNEEREEKRCRDELNTSLKNN